MRFTEAAIRTVPSHATHADPSRVPAARDGQIVRAFLHDRDVACPRCGYNLRDLSGAQCPECAAPLTLHIGSPRFQLGAWLVAFVAACAPFGFAIIMSGLIAYSALLGDAWIESDLAVALILAVADGLLVGTIWLLIKRRELWLAQPAAIRRIRAAAWVAGALLFATALVMILSAALE